MILNQIEQMAQVYGIDMEITAVYDVDYDGLTTLNDDGVYHIEINASAPAETVTHEFGHVLVNELNERNPEVFSEIVNTLQIANDEVLADIFGNLMYQYEYDRPVRDVTYIFPDVETIELVTGSITGGF